MESMQTEAQKERTGKLILAFVSEHERLGQPISKTKLLMLLYLFDIEWYRSHRETYTGFEWRNGFADVEPMKGGDLNDWNVPSV